jgi:Na+/H+ antiporter NhaC
MKKYRIVIILLILTLIILPLLVLSNEIDSATVLKKNYGILSILPPIIAIVLSFITRNVIVSLFIGLLSGTFILSIMGHNLFSAIVLSYVRLCETILNSLATPSNGGIILQCLAIGGLIALLTRVGGMEAIARSLVKKAKTPRSCQIVTWVLGFIIFFDDYANSLIVGPVMRPLTDKVRVSHEKLAFIIDSTAAPIAGISLISTWIAYEIGLIKDGLEYIGQHISAYQVFVETIPFRFYNIFLLIFVFLTAFMLREFGPMYKAEKRARLENKLIADGAKPLISDETLNLKPKSGIKISIWDAIVPLVILVMTAFAGFYFDGYFNILKSVDAASIHILKDHPFTLKAIWLTLGQSDPSIVLFQAALLAGIVSMLMALYKRQLDLGETVNTWLTGVKSLNITAVILLLAWSLSSVMKELKTAEYIVTLLSGNYPPVLLPATIFLFGSIISFATGTSYGTMGILMPLAIPLSYNIDPSHSYLIINISAVLTGAIFGDHCSPISDTTILSSMGAASDHIDHTKTQLIYAIFIAIIALFFAYIPVAAGLNVFLILICNIILIIVFLYFFGKKLAIDETL